MPKIGAGFEVLSPVSIDSRFIKTKTEMLNTNDNLMPEVYPAYEKNDW